MKYKNKTNQKYRSNLESMAAKLLEEANIPFEYEPWVVELLAPSKWSGISYESVGKKKTFKRVERINKITYKPDFVGKNWVMETKGMKTQDFIIRWKLFKKHITDNHLDYVLLMPTNKAQIIKSIELIKELNNGTDKDCSKN